MNNDTLGLMRKFCEYRGQPMSPPPSEMVIHDPDGALEKMADDTDKPLPVVPRLALGFVCPHCEAARAIGDDNAIMHWMRGAQLSIQCQVCGKPVLLTRPEQPRIVQPQSMAPNRHQRRAAESKGLIIPGW